MNAIVKIVLTGIFGFIAFSLLTSFSLDSTVNFLTTNNFSMEQIPVLSMWSGRFLILGVGTLLAFITILIPIAGDIKLFALILEFLGGATAWILT